MTSYNTPRYMIKIKLDQWQLRIKGQVYKYSTSKKKLINIANQYVNNLFEPIEYADIINIDTGEIITIRRS